jgi:hypothetical protein
MHFIFIFVKMVWWWSIVRYMLTMWNRVCVCVYIYIYIYVYGVWLKPGTILFSFSLITQHDILCKKITISLQGPEYDKIHVSSFSFITSKRAPTHYLLHTFLTYVTPKHLVCLCICILLNVYIMFLIVDHSFSINFIYEFTVNFEIFLLHSTVVCQLFFL